MEIRQAEMLNHFETGIFAALDEKKEEMMKSGKKVYNLSVGTPDFKPQQHIVDALVEAAKDPSQYVYALRDLPELLEAVRGRSRDGRDYVHSRFAGRNRAYRNGFDKPRRRGDYPQSGLPDF